MIGIVAVLIIVVGVSLFSGNNISGNVVMGNDNEDSIINMDGNTEAGMMDNSENTAKTYYVDIENFAYNEKELTIKKGDTIIWTNRDSVGHTVTSESGNELDSELLGEGESYSHTFNEAGTYDYYCKPHPYMKGRIVVE